MMNLYAAQKYTERRQAEDRESARIWRLAREPRHRSQPQTGSSVQSPVSTQRQLADGCDIRHSPQGSWPTVQ
jgi:hypothetical protein